MKFYRLAFALSVISVAILTAGCNSTENKAKESTPTPATAAPAEKKEPVLYTGQEAFNRMMGLAIKWSSDAQPVKTSVCSGSRRPDAPPFGVSTEGADSAYNAQSAGLVFSQYLLKTDTDKAVAIAQQHGGDAILKKDPKQSIMYLLLRDPKQNVPDWYVIYGTSATDRKGIGIINATTGAFVSAK